MKNLLIKIAAVVCAYLLCLPAYAKEHPQTSLADRRKAEHYYLEAVIRQNMDDMASYYSLVKRAYELDPTNKRYGYDLGYCLTVTSKSNSVINHGLNLMKTYTDAHPEEYYENYIFAAICLHLGKVDMATEVWETLVSKFPEKIQCYPMLANCYVQKKELKKAIDVYDKLEKAEGMSEAISVKKISYYLALNDTTAAINEGKRLYDAAPLNVSNNMLMGNIYMQLQNTDSAMVFFNKAQEIDPDNGYVNLSKASIYTALGDSLSYEKEITAAIVNKNIDVPTKIDVLTSYIRQNIADNDSSARVDNMFKIIIEQHPHETEFRKLYYSYLAFSKKYSEAAEQLNFALDIDPTDIENWKRLMWLYIYLDKPEKTIETGEKALSYNPEEYSILQISAVAYNRMKEYEKALTLYQEILDKDKDYNVVNKAEIYSGMAEIYYNLKQEEKAFEYYDMALELSPNDYLTMNNYAYFLCLSGKDLEKAKELSEIAVEADPENVSSLDTYAWICFTMQDYKTALEYMDKIFEVGEESEFSTDVYEHYGDILFMNGRPDEALEAWKKALEMNPESEMLKKKVKNKTYFYE